MPTQTDQNNLHDQKLRQYFGSMLESTSEKFKFIELKYDVNINKV